MRSFIAITFLFASLNAFSQADSSGSFVCNNASVLDTSNIANKLFDADFYKNQYFLFGENHGVAAPLAVDLALFKNLYQQAGVRFYVAEMDATKAWLINKYLQTGDTSSLSKVFRSWKADTAQWASQENYRKFQGLQKFYRELPAGQKFQVIGLDVFQDYSLVHEHAVYLTEGLKDVSLRKSVDSLLKITQGATNDDRAGLNEYARRLLPRLIAQESKAKAEMKDRYPAFKHFVTSLGFIGAGMTRDSIFYRNLESLLAINNWEDKKMYGFIGYFHTLQTGYNNIEPFASLLVKHKKATGKVASMQMMVFESKMMMPIVAPIKTMMPKPVIEKFISETPGFPTDQRYVPYTLSNDNSMMLIKGIQELKACSKPNAITLFRLTGENSPFNRSDDLAIISGFQSLKPTNQAVVTSKIFQYVILFRGSGPATPL
ncbi:hypothetical protein LZZ85_15770 [Terrimonas sp. NA20]|uniref:Erythromycin esterase family protein n=1 Tax=Terrimonas ginsenosidimutans TaxID=2908004 RepID=A0ABS9KTV4_9BACT|nr:hypothetical protein [Terrimonas ginsenosidimutans]MCG2615758.1 hypothetical protein [Terrimonas ginsenosidimutans]